MTTAHEHTSGAKRDIWFPIALGLIGLVIGYSIGSLGGGTRTNPAVVPTPTDNNANQPAPAGPLPPVDLNADHIRGNKDATVAVVEYSDFECPFCKNVDKTYQEIMTTYGNKVMWVYRHFPLSFHQNAQKEAEASECVADLGGNDAFWKFLDTVYSETTSNGTGFALDKLAPLAKSLGVDETKFNDCLNSGKFTQKVQDMESKGSAAGVDGTPANFVVNMKTGKSQLVTGAVPIASFKTVIDQYLK